MTRNPTKRRIYDFSRGEGCLVLCGCKIELKPVTPMQYCTVSTLTFTTVFNYILFNSPTEVKRGAASHPIHPLPKSDPATPTDPQKSMKKETHRPALVDFNFLFLQIVNRKECFKNRCQILHNTEYG